MSWNRDIWAETQEVTFVGLLILRTVRDRPHTTHWKQRLTENRRSLLETQITNTGS